MFMNTTMKRLAWLGIVLDALVTFKYTWLRENASLLVKQLTNLHLVEIWTYLTSDRCNLVPFHTIGYYMFDSHNLWSSFINVAGNMVLFIPLGLLLPFIGKDASHIVNRQEIKGLSYDWRIIVTGFSFSLLIEIGQLLMEVGAFDVDDLILNTLGGWLGFRLLLAMSSAVHRRNPQLWIAK